MARRHKRGGEGAELAQRCEAPPALAFGPNAH